MEKTAPTILIIFGATGDLVRRKLAPALFHLWKARMMPERFRVVGFSRRDWSDEEYREYIGEMLRVHLDLRSRSETSIVEESITAFLRLVAYAKGDFNSAGDYKALSKILAGIDREWGVCTNKLLYLAATPEFFRTIFENLAASGLTKPCDSDEWIPLEVSRPKAAAAAPKEGGPLTGWTRIVVEKPFGKDAQTARELDELLAKLFQEPQIYRIDHYLAKEMLQSILTFRFSNNLFEANWSNEAIEKVEIKLREAIGVEDRGAFYEGVGALRDVGQNHLLQMIAFLAMERPDGYGAEPIRAKRVELLKQLRMPTWDEVSQSSIRAQYEGYREIKGVKPDSETETYFKIKAELDSPRWRGVPFILESGKRMPEQRKEVNVIFKHPVPCLCPQDTHYQNKIVFGIEPEEKITIHFWSKKPGLTFEMEERTFDFLLREAGKRKQYVEEYEKLLLDCITGDQTLFVSTEEVRAMWRFIDPIVRAWEENAVPLKFYGPGAMNVA